MTMQEYKRVQCPAILEPFWIGQGYGYKNMSPLLRTESVSYTHLFLELFGKQTGIWSLEHIADRLLWH